MSARQLGFRSIHIDHRRRPQLYACQERSCGWADAVLTLDGLSSCPDHGIHSCRKVVVGQVLRVRCPKRRCGEWITVPVTDETNRADLTCLRHSR